MNPIQSSLDERLIQQAKLLDSLTQLVRQQLPPECDQHYHVANIRRQSLVIITDSPVWTTRLRQLAPEILKVIQDAGIPGIRHIEVTSRVGYHAPARQPPPEVERSMSASAADIIDSTAECISDEGLRDALHKLAKRGRP